MENFYERLKRKDASCFQLINILGIFISLLM